MNFSIINRSDEVIAAFELLERELLNPDGTLKIKSASFYDQFPFDAVRLFCNRYSRYLLPTEELIVCLKELIGGRHAIEIGAGCGDLGRNLGIQMTDSYNQEFPDVKAYYAALGQPTIQYGKDVQKLNALDAIDFHKPKVVVGAWVTQWIDPNLAPPAGGGNVYGIKEDIILDKVETYIVVGAAGIHQTKPIMRRPHETIDAEEFVRSRRQDNKIWIWNQKPKIHN